MNHVNGLRVEAAGVNDFWTLLSPAAPGSGSKSKDNLYSYFGDVRTPSCHTRWLLDVRPLLYLGLEDLTPEKTATIL